MKHRILFLAANPAGLAARKLDVEAREIQREIELATARDRFEFVPQLAAQPMDLLHALRRIEPSIVHFVGHDQADGIYLTGNDDKPMRVTREALSATFGATGSVQLVVLNGCATEDLAKVLCELVPICVGTSSPISDAAARTFSVGFYGALASRESAARACSQGRAAMLLMGTGEHTPLLHHRPDVDPGTFVLADIVTAPAPPSSLPPAPAASPAPPSRPIAARNHSGPMQYDLFLAHPSADKPSARALYSLLQPDVRVFLDERSLQPGDDWDRQIPIAQRASRATVVLISSYADAAWYLRTEIVTAIALHRAMPSAHLLVPVLLERGVPLPYGLSHVQAIDAIAEGGLAGVAARLREVVARIRAPAAPSPAGPAVTVAGPPPSLLAAAPAAALASGCDHVHLHERMTKLTDVIFEEILLHARVERRHVAPKTAPLADRILDLTQLAAADPDLYRRITALLDQRAPWTR